MKRAAAEVFVLLFAGGASTLFAQATVDTVLRAQSGVTVRVDMSDGTLRVGIGAQGQVRVRAGGDSSPPEVLISSRGDTIAVMSRGAPRGKAVVHYDLTVSSGTRLIVVANDAEVFVTGALADAEVTAQHGRVEMSGIRSFARAMLFRGPVIFHGITGRAEATSLRGDIEVMDVRGDVFARNTDGHIHLADIDGDSVTAQSVDGEVAYKGMLRAAGVYQLSSHKETVRLNPAPGFGASVHGTTVHGVFTRPELWVLDSPGDSSSRHMTIGNGGASVRLSTFRGSIAVSLPR